METKSRKAWRKYVKGPDQMPDNFKDISLDPSRYYPNYDYNLIN